MFLDWPEGKKLPSEAGEVAAEIRAVLSSFKDIFARDLGREEKLKDMITLADQIESAEMKSYGLPNDGMHRLVSYADQSPIFCSMDPDPGFVGGAAGITSKPADQELERLGRLLILLYLCGACQLTGTQINAIGLLCRNLPRLISSKAFKPLPSQDSQYRNRYLELQGQAAVFIKERNWEGLDHFLANDNEDLNDDVGKLRFGELRMIVQLLDQLLSPKSVQKQAEPPPRLPLKSSKPKTPPKDKVRNPLSKYRKAKSPPIIPLEDDPEPEEEQIPPVPLDPDDPNVTSAGVVVTPKAEVRTENLPEESLKELTVRGSQLRFYSIWSGQSIEALTATEARLCMDYLRQLDTHSTGEEIARIILMLSGLYGWKANNIIAAFKPQFDHNEPVPEIWAELLGSELYLSIAVLGAEYFAEVPPALLEEKNFSEVDQVVRFKTSLDQLTSTPEILAEISSISSREDELLQDILRSLDALNRQLLHNVTTRFSYHRWRSAFVQAVVMETSDIPLMQLLLCEEFGFNASSLHYIAFDSDQINRQLRKVRTELWGEPFADVVQIATKGLIGAPWAGLRLEPIVEVSRGLQTAALTGSLKTKGVVNVAHHNALVDWVAWIMMLVTASRNNVDFGKLTLDQLSLQANAIIYEDKPADPSIYRRVAGLPDFVVLELYRLITHIRQLRDYLRRFPKKKSEYALSQSLTQVLESRLPLLFSLTENIDADGNKKKPLLEMSPWQARTFINTYFGDEYRLNLCRHFFSSQLRRQELLPAFLIESQLGHIMGNPLFGEDSVVSVAEFSEAINEPLERYLSACGVVVTERFNPRPNMKEIPLKTLCEIREGIKDRKRADRQLLRSQRGLEEVEKAAGRIETVIHAELRKHQGLKEGEPHKRKFEISKEACIEVSRRILEQIPGDEKILVGALKKIRGTLNHLKQTQGWKVEFPPPIFWHIASPIRLTKFHLNAYDAWQALIKHFDRSCRLYRPDQIHEAAGLFLVLLDYVNDFDELWEILSTKRTPYLLEPERAWALDIHLQPDSEYTCARTLYQPAAYALDASFSSKVPLPSKSVFFRNIYLLLPNQWQGDARSYRSTLTDLEDLKVLGRLVSAPIPLADVMSGKMPQRELTAKRLAEFINDSGTNDSGTTEALVTNKGSEHETLFDHSEIEPEIRRGQFQEEIDALKKMLPGTNEKGSRPWRGAEAKLHELLTGKPHPTMRCIIQWVLQLLEPNANKKTQGPLAKKTVHDYLVDVSTILVESLGDAAITEFEEEELFELIQKTLDHSENVREKSHIHVTRFFDDISQISNLPRLQFIDESKGLEGIDARIITRKEHNLIIEQLSQWAEDENLSVGAQRGLRSAQTYSAVQYRFGSRRNELAYLRADDAISSAGVWVIRRSNQRTLKSAAAQRLLSFETGFNECIRVSNDPDSPWLFSGFHERRLEIRPLNLVTEATRYATGDAEARLHHNRHSVPTRVIPELFALSDILERWRAAARLAAMLGHVNIRITLSHYCHSVRLAFARRYTRSLEDTPAGALEYFTSTENSSLFRKSDSCRSFVKRVATHYEKTPPFQKAIRADLPVDIKTIEPKPEDIIGWFQSLFRGRAGLVFADTQIPQAIQDKLLSEIADLQDMTDFTAVDQDVIHARLLGNGQTSSQTDRRNISPNLFASWAFTVKEISLTDMVKAAAELSQFSQGIHWKGRQVSWFCRTRDRDTIRDLIGLVGMPIECRFSDDADNVIQLTIPESFGSNAQSSVSIRVLLMLVLSIAAL